MSTFQLQPCVDLDLSKKELQDLVDKAKDWALMHGMYFHKKVITILIIRFLNI